MTGSGVGRPRRGTTPARSSRSELPPSLREATPPKASVELGRVGKPHGVHGEVRLHLHWVGGETLAQVSEVQVDLGRESRVLELESVRPGSKALLLKLVGVDRREQAELLRNAGLSVPRSALPPLDEDEYYLVDLMGARVEGPDGELGTVVEVRTHPSVDTVVIRTPRGKLLEQVLSPPWVDGVFPEDKRIVLSSTDGLI